MTGSDIPVPDPTTLTTAQLDRAITGLKETVEAELAGFKEIVQLQFDLIANWRLEQKDDTKVRLDAAFAAQKEAIIKQENATDRQIEQLKQMFQGAYDELRRAIDEMKSINTTALAGMGSRLDVAQGYQGGARVEERQEAIIQQIDTLSASIVQSGGVKQGGDQARAAMYAFAGFVTSLIIIGGFVAAVWPR